jgi:glycerate kinase
MRVLICPDSFKGSMSAVQVAEAMARGVEAAGAEADRCPVSDGGEGFVESMQAAAGGQWQTTQVVGPLGESVDAKWVILPDQTAVLEMAAASGLGLVPDHRRDPTLTTTFGTGQMIQAAIDAGCGKILLGIGGSATCDGGAGMAQALGTIFTNAQGEAFTQPLTGGELSQIASIDAHATANRLADVEIVVACDVTNPLTGPSGAATIYGPQKGATPAQVEQLEAGLVHLGTWVEQNRGSDATVIADRPGAGAAGGLGFGLMAWCDAELRPGIDIVLDQVGFDQRSADCDLSITGEGRLDSQTLSGKVIAGIAERSASPVAAIAGSVEPNLDAQAIGLALIRSLTEQHDVTYAMQHGPELLTQIAREVIAKFEQG